MYVDREVDHLCVEGIKIQHVFALELLRVDLLKGDPVGGPVKDVYLGQHHELFALLLVEPHLSHQGCFEGSLLLSSE